MRGTQGDRIRRWLALALLAALAGCYYRRYDPLVRTHVELMIAMAEKRRDVGTRNEPVVSSAEFAYPLERARDFARIVHDRFGDRQSFREFEGFLARYGEFLAIAATPRADPELLSAELKALRAAGESVLAALDAEKNL